MQRITPQHSYPLYSVESTRAIEHEALSALPANTLMQRAGLAVARLACAVAPHAQSIWIACGPGNNGGDGLEAAVHLHARGHHPVVTWLGESGKLPTDAHAAWERAMHAGVVFSAEPPEHADLCIDALLGIGSTRPPQGQMAQWIAQMNRMNCPVLAVDVPTGLHADTGACDPSWVHATHTLSLLTLKPGLFTAIGRDAAGVVWWDDLGVDGAHGKPVARLPGEPTRPSTRRLHASHKGSRGDVAIVGGATGMTGAALLAGSAALHAGAGRVYLCLLNESPHAMNPLQPELMLRNFSDLELGNTTVVCGCGGGTRVKMVLPELLQHASRLVLDADALNAIASDAALQGLLTLRNGRHATVLTPHPLEAARMLGTQTAQVQADRIAAANQLAQRFQCVVVLKGSGTITATPGETSVVNPTGNGLLATGGTGDVLAGLVGARLAAGEKCFDAAWTSVFQHGQVADGWSVDRALTASALARALT